MALELDSGVMVRGVILKGSGKGYRIPRTILANLIGVLGTYRKKTVNNTIIEIKAPGFSKEIKTAKHGFFHSIIPKVSVEQIEIYHKGKKLPLSQEYPFAHELGQTKIDIISDIDDTVLVSNAASIFKRLYTLLFFRPKKRKAVVHTYDFLGRASEKGFRTIYLSKSESNLFGLISTFIKNSDLPKGALILTPHLNIRQLFTYKKGKDYKEKNIEGIIENSRGRKFILLGDDSQGDLMSYSRIVKKFEDRIKAVLIRKTGFGLNSERENFLKEIRASGIKTLYFSDQDEPDYSILELG